MIPLAAESVMEQVIPYTLLLAAIIRLPALATIINIPDDYDTIQEGIDASTDGDTVLVQPGTYVENINFNGHNIVLGSLFLTTGDTAYIPETIIDGDSSGSVVRIENHEDSTSVITGFTIQNGYINSMGGGIECRFSNPRIVRNIIKENYALTHGGGISCSGRNPIIMNNVIIRNNAGGNGCGIHCWNSNPVIANNLIVDNHAGAGGGGIGCFMTSGPVIINNTIARNLADHGGGGIWGVDLAIIKNSIFWGNVAPEGSQIYSQGGSSDISYSDIQGGWEGEGNIDADPLFRDADNGDFHIMSTACGDPYDSPCIDAGDPSIFDYLLDCDWGLGGERSDMGAYGGQAIRTDIGGNHDPSVPMTFGLYQNYPNPFNATTTINYSLPESGEVAITIYNLLGQRVATLFEGNQQAGRHSLVWDATEFPSGVYFARLGAKEYSKSIKMMLLK